MDITFMLEILPQFLSVLPITLMIIVVSSLIGFLLSILVAAIRIKKVKLLNPLMGMYISFTRSTPILLQLFLIYYGLPVVLALMGIHINDINATTASIITLIIYNGAYMSEVIRPAYLAVERGQHEAADSLGFSSFKKLTRIIIPQVAPIALPGLGNAIIYLIHDTSLVFAIGVVDIMGFANIIISSNYGMNQIEIYLTIAIIYWMISMVSEQIIKYLEKRKQRLPYNGTVEEAA
ncbi:amino acid ABC transporter permease [Oceanobacillus sp. Castelsardo]|uniref:amino acid ABC transporter permease n=1 Tax=Oceanobacillus sp. Castelsardo TaxID=1851204 RepID=UPI00083844F3|nr:amino acid ABC transporter permease [Oceanobacillus sp. Castelsardo]